MTDYDTVLKQRVDDARERYRQQVKPNEHQLLGKLVLLRADLNDRFGGNPEFDQFDRRMANLELEIADLIVRVPEAR